MSDELTAAIFGLIGTFVGGAAAILGGVIAQWYGSKLSLKNRMKEIVAERKVDANAEAYANLKYIQARLGRGEIDLCLKFMLDKEAWFIKNRLYLPGKLPGKWFDIRNNLSGLYVKIEGKTTPYHPTIIKLQAVINQAINDIYSEMELSEIETEDLSEIISEIESESLSEIENGES